jgi:hypothetical protein
LKPKGDRQGRKQLACIERNLVPCVSYPVSYRALLREWAFRPYVRQNLYSCFSF